MPASAKRSVYRMARCWAVSTGRRNALDLGGCDVDEGTGLGPGIARGAALAWAATGGAAGRAGPVLGGDRGGAHERGRGTGGGSISSRRGQVVPEVRRHATHASVRLGQVAVGAHPFVRGARGDRVAPGPKPRRARHRPVRRPRALDDLARAAAQRGDPPRRSRVPRLEPRSGTPIGPRAGPRRRSWRGTKCCAAMWRIVWRAGSRGRTAPRCPARAGARPGPGRSADRSGASTGGGGEPGAPDRTLGRSRPGSGSTSPETKRCASRTRRSTNPFASRAGAACGGS